jgi:hypothetical protein
MRLFRSATADIARGVTPSEVGTAEPGNPAGSLRWEDPADPDPSTRSARSVRRVVLRSAGGGFLLPAAGNLS